MGGLSEEERLRRWAHGMGGAAEEPVRVRGVSAAGWKDTRRSEKAKVSEEALLIGGVSNVFLMCF
jgi:hypothetical protein